MIAFVRLLELDDKAEGLAQAAAEWRSARVSPNTFEIDPRSFGEIPGSAFVYWVSERVRALFSEMSPLEAGGRSAKAGLQTSDDFRFVRAWWEVEVSKRAAKWIPYAKGGAYSPFYTDIHLVVNWLEGGREIDATNRAYLRNSKCYLRPGLTWPYRPHRRGAFSLVPHGCVFSTSGMMIFAPHDSLWELSAVLNSSVYGGLLHLLMPRGVGSDEQTLKYEVGFIGSVPVPTSQIAESEQLCEIAQEGWGLVRRQDEQVESSRAFIVPEVVQATGPLLVDRMKSVDARRRTDARSLADVATKLDALVFDLYGIPAADRASLVSDFEAPGAPSWSELPFRFDRDRKAMVRGLLEWVFGVALGRFDVRLAAGNRKMPPDPFDPLPLCSPGMLQDEHGFPATEAPSGYPLELPPHGILVDDPGHPWDVVSRIEAALDIVAGDNAHVWLQEVETVLGRGLRDWLRRYGFQRHLKRYSRSHRKAPLFWHLAPKSRQYGIWLYSPLATRDTLYRILNDYVDPRLKSAERRLLELRQEAGASPTGQQRRDLTDQESLVEELRVFREEVARVAPLWVPHCDDGVVLNCALLWRLFDHHRSWQKECKKQWGELAKGKYDWAGWAMHLWPERVVETCASDRSIAIAHGLEDTLWEEDEDGKWELRPDTEEQVAKLTARRHSPAIQAGLYDFARANSH